jgi:hypothetical protein
MKTLAFVTAACSIVALLVLPLPATATTISECQDAIAALVLQTESTTFAGGVGNKAQQCQAKCEAKLFQASKSLDQARFADAVQQMSQYEAAVGFCGDKDFVADADVVALQAAAEAVITCINQFGL